MQFYCIGGGGGLAGSENQSVSGVSTICLTQCNTSPSLRVYQVVDCGLWNVGPLLFNGCVKLLDIGRNWNTLSYTPIQSIPNLLNGWHVWWVCWPCKNWDVFSFQELCTDPCNMGLCINNNNNLLHLYSAFLDTQSALHSKGAISSSTTNVHHPPGWCDGSHSAPERPPHTSLLVERRQSDEANQCMGMIRRPWWSEASGLVWPGCRMLLFFKGHPGIFNDHRESGPRFNVSSEGRCFFQYSVPFTILGH